MTSFCADCDVSIGLFKRKHKCKTCMLLFCGRCFAKTLQMTCKGNRVLKSCLKCNIFSISVFRREELLLLSTKDLRGFLVTKNISIKDCRERYHLVDLIMNFAEQNGQKSLTDIRREENRKAHVESLRLESQRREADEQEREVSEGNVVNAAQYAQQFEQNLPGTPLQTEPFNIVPQWKSIEDICSLDDIKTLSVLQLKKILTVNFVGYKGCFEKDELIERVKRLWSSKHDQQNDEVVKKDATAQVYDENLCKVCMDSAIDCVLLDCGHLVTCTKCGRQLNECPICRQLVVRVVHVFKA